MRILLFVLGLVAFLYGASVMAIAQSAVHEIEAFILFLIGAVFVSGAAIVEAVNAVRKNSRHPYTQTDDMRLSSGGTPPVSVLN